MILVFGGAYQGKTAFVTNDLNIPASDMYVCTDKSGISYDNQIINRFHEFVYGMILRSADPISYVNEHLSDFQGKVIIMDDVCSGVVPLGKENRLFRECAGKIMQIFSRNADEVYRVFCGVAERLK